MSASQQFVPLRDVAAYPGARLSQLLRRRELSIILVCFAIVQLSLGHHNGDNSWLFTLCEKILDGARPYVDVIETNPPASFMLYMPAVALARWLHLPAEFVVSVCVFAAAIASIAFTGVVLRASGLQSRRDEGFAFNAAIFVLIVLPGFSFGEREHIAAIAILPVLAVYAARAMNLRVSFSNALGAGLLAGLTMAIKPHFALAIALPLIVALWRRRSFSPLFQIENLAATGVVLAYVAVVFLRYPEFFSALPSIIDAYVPVREPFDVLLAHPWFLANCVLLTVLAGVGRQRCHQPCVAVLIAASLGFLGAYIAQGKGWVNHGLPGVALTMLAMCLVAAPAMAELAERRDLAAWTDLRRMILFGLAPAVVGLPILFGTVMQFSQLEEHPGLTAAVRRVGPPRPKIIALSGELDLGHPLVRTVGGEWVGQSHSLWLMLSAQFLLETRRGDATRLAQYVDQDARMFADNVRDRKPDIILVGDGEWTERMSAHRYIATAMKNYELVETVTKIGVWRPKQGTGAP